MSFATSLEQLVWMPDAPCEAVTCRWCGGETYVPPFLFSDTSCVHGCMACARPTRHYFTERYLALRASMMAR